MTPRETRFAIDGLTAIVILSVAGALASLTWRLAGESSGISSLETAMGGQVRGQPAPDISPVLSLAPFGRTVVQTGPPIEASNLILRGIMLATPGPASTALIEVEGSPSAVVRTGEALPGGGVLERIDIDYVVIRAGEQLFALYFPGDERGAAEGAAIAAIPDPQQAPNPGSAPATSKGVAAIRALLPSSVTGETPTVQTPPAPVPPAANGSRSLIDSLGATATPQGYRVGPNLSPQMRAAGLRAGDVVASMNDVEASRLINDNRMLEQVLSSGQVRVTVLRDNARVTMSLPTR